MTDVPPSSPELTALRSRITELTNINERLQKLRKIPTHLIRPPPATSFSAPLHLQSVQQPNTSELLPHEIKAVGELSELLRSEKVQEALIYARDSEQKDKSDLRPSKRRENRKRRRPPSPESPRSYASFQPQSSSLFPVDSESPHVQLDGLSELVREYNKEHGKITLQIITPSPRRSLEVPLVVRYIIRDIATVYLTLNMADDSNLIVENVTALGPREQKPSHSLSDFNVYQNLSQQITKMIQSKPQVSLRTVLGLLSSYENLFVQRCNSCERILSAEAHVPPVARVWTERGSDGNPGWEPWHPACLQR